MRPLLKPLLLIATAPALLLPAASIAAPAAAPARAAPAPAAPTLADARFDRFFDAFRQAVLANDRQKVADMVALPFKDYSGAEPDRSATTRARFLAHYDAIFTPEVIAAIRDRKLRAFQPGADDGEAPGPIRKGEVLLVVEDLTHQLIFAPRGTGYALNRIPFYS
jgi:hypothetical protein